MPNLGIFAGGVASGYDAAQAIELAKSRDKRAQDEFALNKQVKDLAIGKVKKEDQAWQGLADLVSQYSDPQPVAKTPIPARGGINPTAAPAPDDGGPVDGDTPDVVHGAGVPQMGGNVGSIARDGIGRTGAKLGSETADVQAQSGPKTNEERIGYGMWRNPNLFRDPSFTRDAAQIFLRAGMPQGVAWLEKGAQAASENAIDSLKRMIGGDARGAEEAFNASGGRKVVPGSAREVGSGKWEVQFEGGQTRTFDPRQVLRSTLNPKEFFNLEMKDRELQSKDEQRKDAATFHDQVATETERHNRAWEKIQQQLVAVRDKLGVESETALKKNIDFLVSSGVAKDPSEAFQKLRVSTEKPESDAILSVMGTLMKGSGYRGKDGTQRALQDATSIVRSIKGGGSEQAPAAASRFKSAEEVRGAYQAGKIDRQSAMKELTNFGMSSE